MYFGKFNINKHGQIQQTKKKKNDDDDDMFHIIQKMWFDISYNLSFEDTVLHEILFSWEK